MQHPTTGDEIGLEKEPNDTGTAEAERVGNYEAFAVISEGTTARLFRARHVHPKFSGQTYALKLLRPETSRNARMASRFQNEAAILRSLQHPNIVRAYEAGHDQGRLFIASEYVRGHDLGGLFDKARSEKRLLPSIAVLFIASEVLKGLSAAHELTDIDGESRCLVHRDIKPANILVSFGGRVKIINFGVAVGEAPDQLNGEPPIGTQGFIAPEQIRGDGSDARSDLFAVGACLFEGLAGWPLFDGPEKKSLYDANHKALISSITKLNPAVPNGLASVIAVALNPDPDKRFQSAREMLEALAPFVPTTAGMHIAVASLMRSHFAEALHDEATFQRQIAERASVSAVAWLALDEPKPPPIAETLLASRLNVEVFYDLQDLHQALMSPMPPEVVIADLRSPSLMSQGARALEKTKPPRIAYATEFNESNVDNAYHLGAVDILLPPFSPLRLLSAAAGALVAESKQGEQFEGWALKHRLLVICASPKERDRLSYGLRAFFDVSTAANLDEARQSMNNRTYPAMVINDDIRFDSVSAAFKGLSSIGQVKQIFLTDKGDYPDGPTVKRRPGGDSAENIRGAIHAIDRGLMRERRFPRLPTSIAAQLTSMTNTDDGVIKSVSRGGLSLTAKRALPRGDLISLVFSLGASGSCEIEGTVLWVAVGADVANEPYELGIEFVSFAPGDEPKFIAWLEEGFIGVNPERPPPDSGGQS